MDSYEQFNTIYRVLGHYFTKHKSTESYNQLFLIGFEGLDQFQRSGSVLKVWIGFEWVTHLIQFVYHTQFLLTSSGYFLSGLHA